MHEPTPLRLRCPACGGTDLIYTCDPGCCFNHVCSGCRRAVYPSTEVTGRRVVGLTERPPPGCTDPTVACDACGSLAVYMLGDEPVCTRCGAVLALRLGDSPG